MEIVIIKVYALFLTIVSNLAYVQRWYEGRIFFTQLENRYEEDDIFLHNLFCTTEITRIFLSEISLQPVLVI
jgi:hypothetical protein